MKIGTREQEKAHQHAAVVGGAKGLFGSLALALPTSYFLHKRWPYYRSLPPSLKALGIITVAIPSFVVAAERAALAFDRSQWSDVGKQELDTVEARKRAKWEIMSTGQKIGDWAARHQYSIIGTSWAAGMLGAWSWYSRDPYASTLQKITQTRVWAQGLTLGVIIAAGALTHGRTNRREDKYGNIKPEVDHSWRDMIEMPEESSKSKKS